MFLSFIGLVIGGLIGVSFGLVQDAARRNYERLQQGGKLGTAWAVVPGSGRRIAFLLLALVLVQILCPLLFKDSVRWWVSGGVVLGYGGLLFWRLRQR